MREFNSTGKGGNERGSSLFPFFGDLSLGAADDSFVFESGASVGNVSLGAGFDDFSYTLSGITVDAGEGEDSVILVGTGNSVDGGAHNDTINVGDDSHVNGGTGADSITVGNNSAVEGGTGEDTITAKSGNNIIFAVVGKYAEHPDGTPFSCKNTRGAA